MSNSHLINISSHRGLLWHEDFIVHLASIIRPRVYVELGLSKCAVFNRIIPFAEKLIGVDVDPRAETFMQKSEKTRFVLATTQEFAKQLAQEQLIIDMLFIDADHDQEAVLNDFRSFFPFVSPHGIILLHDVHPGSQALIRPE